MRGVLIFGDSLAFHGPDGPELLTHPRLYPNVLAGLLDCNVDCVARAGWTARDAWWALTRDPQVYSVLLPRADAVVLAVGNRDQLPASLPTYLADGIACLRPEWLRRGVRAAYHAAHPWVARVHGGRLRVLPQRETDRYLTLCVTALRALRPDLAVVGFVPPPHNARYHGHVTRSHAAAAAAAHAWGRRHDVPMIDVDALISPYLESGRMNADGMHWTWEAHAEVAHAIAQTVRDALKPSTE